MEAKEECYPVNCLRVCIDVCSETDLIGRIYSPLAREALHFNDIREMLLKTDAMFDEAGYPQAFQAKRSFKEGERLPASYAAAQEIVRPTSCIINQFGEAVTYNVVVMTRQHTSWQGIVYSTDGVKINSFSGDLELLELLMAR